MLYDRRGHRFVRSIWRLDRNTQARLPQSAGRHRANRSQERSRRQPRENFRAEFGAQVLHSRRTEERYNIHTRLSYCFDDSWLSRADTARMIRHNLSNFRAGSPKGIRQVAPGSPAARQQDAFPTQRRPQLASQRHSEKFFRNVIDRERLRCRGAGRRGPYCRATRPVAAFRISTQLMASARKKSRRVRARKQQPIVGFQRTNGAIEVRRIGRFGKTHRGKQQDFCAKLFQAFLQITRLFHRACDHDALSIEWLVRAHARVPRPSRARSAAAPCSSNLAATLSPSGTASSGVLELFSLMRCAPSGESTATSSTSFPPSTRPHAPMDTWQPPSRPARRARSASTPLRVSSSFNAERIPRVSVSLVRASIPIAPCPAAGRQTSVDNTSVIFALRDRKSVV